MNNQHKPKQAEKFKALQKNFYSLHEDNKNRPLADSELYMAENEITTEGKDIPRPV